MSASIQFSEALIIQLLKFITIFKIARQIYVKSIVRNIPWHLFFNHLHPNISLQVLDIVLYTFPMVPRRTICHIIKSLLNL